MLFSRQLLPAAAIVAALFVALPFMGSTAPGPTVIFVDDDAAFGGDGSSWSMAYKFLQDALANAVAGEEIRVAQGSYKPDQDEGGNVTPSDRLATFQLVSGVSLMGGYAGIGQANPDDRDFDLYITNLSGDLLGNDRPGFVNNDENSYHVVAGSGVAAVLDGVTITGGNANGNFPENRGGAVLATLSTLTVANCTFNGNSVQTHGGAMFVQGGTVTITNCTFKSNRSVGTSGTAGGAITFFGDSNLAATIVDCLFEGNEAFLGGAVASASFNNSPTVVTIVNCSMSDNRGTGVGGAVFSQDNLTVLENCTIEGNEAGGVAGEAGGGLFNQLSSTVILTNCRLTSNTAVNGGGLFNTSLSMFSLINCTLSENSAEEGGGILNLGAGTVENCVLWANSDAGGSDESAQVHIDGGGVDVDFSCVQGLTGGLGGLGNIDADPLFVDPDNGNFRLSTGSPCIDAADNTAVPEDVTTDLDGNPRFFDDPDTPDTGNGTPPIVDMGAYEFQLPCPWDLDSDGNVFVTDLLLLLADFGACNGSPADFDGDGCVTVVDLLALIANFGPCPGSECVWDVNGDGIVDNDDVQQVIGNPGPCNGCPEDVNGDGVVDGSDAAAVATHFGPCP